MSQGAFISIHTATCTEKQVLRAVRAVGAVRHAHIVSGMPDIIAYIEVREFDMLQGTIDKIRQIEGITKTVTQITLD